MYRGTCTFLTDEKHITLNRTLRIYFLRNLWMSRNISNVQKINSDFVSKNSVNTLYIHMYKGIMQFQVHEIPPLLSVTLPVLKLFHKNLFLK